MSDLTKGTPKTLEDAISNGLHNTVIRSAQVSEVAKHIRDFLAQSLCAERMRASESEDEILKRLMARWGFK